MSDDLSLRSTGQRWLLVKLLGSGVALPEEVDRVWFCRK